ncbi:MAG: hypothetical protein AAF889_03575 [Cyanobacteria bacterium P01_D01_bin.73]
MIKVLVVPLTLLLVGCQQITEFKAKSSGSEVPRNPREKVIFDYFNALQNKDYEEACRLRAQHSACSQGAIKSFKQVYDQHHQDLPTLISIGEEERVVLEESNCGYAYTVYAAYPNTLTLHSGLVGMRTKADKSEGCFIEYNSSFGSVP